MIDVEERKIKEREQEAHELALKEKSKHHGKGKPAPKKHDEEKNHDEEKKHIDQKVEPDKGKSARG